MDQPIHAVARFIGKLDLKIKELDQLHGGINDVFGSGAVEGYSEKQLDSTTLAKKTLGVMVLPYDSNEIASEVFPLAPSLRHEAELRDLYKKATKSLHG